MERPAAIRPLVDPSFLTTPPSSWCPGHFDVHVLAAAQAAALQRMHRENQSLRVEVDRLRSVLDEIQMWVIEGQRQREP